MMKVVIGLRGPAGSGKDTVADYLVEKYGFTKVTFGGAVKEIVAIISGWDINMLSGTTPESRIFRETENHSDFGMTAREMMQKIGTDLFRQYFDENTWINIVRRKVKTIPGNIVISDIRFPNEAKLVQELGGYIFTLVRKDIKRMDHISEQNFPIENEIIIDNSNDLPSLYNSVDNLIG